MYRAALTVQQPLNSERSVRLLGAAEDLLFAVSHSALGSLLLLNVRVSLALAAVCAQDGAHDEPKN